MFLGWICTTAVYRSCTAFHIGSLGSRWANSWSVRCFNYVRWHEQGMLPDVVVPLFTTLTTLLYTPGGGWRMAEVHGSNTGKMDRKSSPTRRIRGARISEDTNSYVNGAKFAMTGCHTPPTMHGSTCRRQPWNRPGVFYGRRIAGGSGLHISWWHNSVTWRWWRHKL